MRCLSIGLEPASYDGHLVRGPMARFAVRSFLVCAIIFVLTFPLDVIDDFFRACRSNSVAKTVE